MLLASDLECLGTIGLEAECNRDISMHDMHKHLERQHIHLTSKHWKVKPSRGHSVHTAAICHPGQIYGCMQMFEGRCRAARVRAPWREPCVPPPHQSWHSHALPDSAAVLSAPGQHIQHVKQGFSICQGCSVYKCSFPNRYV